MHQLGFSIFCFVSCLSCFASAQDLPKYDGVYVLDEVNKVWVDVKASSLDRDRFFPADATYASIERSFPIGMGGASLFGMDESSFEALPMIGYPEKGLTIFLRGRQPDFEFLDRVVSTNDFLKAVAVSGGTTVGNSRAPEPNAQIDFSLLYWGTGESGAKIRTIDEYSTEIFVPESEFDSQNDSSDCVRCSLQVFGFAIGTSETRAEDVLAQYSNRVTRYVFRVPAGQ